jgi:DUF1365 family protein
MKSFLCVGKVRHRRFAPVKHSFEYPICYYWLNLSELPKIFRFPFFFSLNFPGILSFWRKDYLGDKKMSLESEIQKLILDKTHQPFSGTIRLLTNISYLGFCFNPVSFYFCYETNQNQEPKLRYIVSEVTNTPWGERHQDVFQIENNENAVFHFPKEFHVSPFMPMEMDYEWMFKCNEEEILINMQNRNRGEKELLFDATLKVKTIPLRARNIVMTFFAYPLMTFKALFAIYKQAAILYFIKKIPFYTHPKKVNPL